jgi:uncharacterized membrane protein
MLGEKMSENKISSLLSWEFRSNESVEVLVFFERELDSESIAAVNKVLEGTNSSLYLVENRKFAAGQMQEEIANNLAALSIVQSITVNQRVFPL